MLSTDTTIVCGNEFLTAADLNRFVLNRTTDTALLSRWVSLGLGYSPEIGSEPNLLYSGVNESDEKDRGQKMYADTYIF